MTLESWFDDYLAHVERVSDVPCKASYLHVVVLCICEVAV